MSGGAYDYKYSSLDVYSGELEDGELNELLEDFRLLLHDLEWYKSGDTSEDDYKESISKFKDKWLPTFKDKWLLNEQVNKLRHWNFQIGELLVEESKCHISSQECCERIRNVYHSGGINETK